MRSRAAVGVALLLLTLGAPAAAAPVDPTPTPTPTSTSTEPVPDPAEPTDSGLPEAQRTAPPEQEPACSPQDASLWIPRDGGAVVRLGAAQAQALPGLRQPVVVAVVDAGVSRGNPHLDPALLPPVVLTAPEPNDSADAQRDRQQHGTQIAAMIAARDLRPAIPSNLVGVAPSAMVQPVVAFTSEDSDVVSNRLSPATIAAGIRAATDSGAAVINVSYSAATSSPALESAVADAVAAGRLVVASAGNDRTDGDRYPAALPGVLAVAAVGADDVVPAEAPQGPSIDLAAPGSDVVGVSVARDCRVAGPADPPQSSWSTAYVSGAAALVWSSVPTATAEEVVYRLTASADRPQRSARNDATGWGVVQPWAAITMTIDPARPGPPLPGQPVPETTPVASEPIVVAPTTDPMAVARRDVVRWGLLGAAGLGLLLLLTRWNRLGRRR